MNKVSEYLGVSKVSPGEIEDSNKVEVSAGLAYPPAGEDVIIIEATHCKGSGMADSRKISHAIA